MRESRLVHGFRPDLTERLVGVTTTSAWIHEEWRTTQALVTGYVSFDPLRELLTDGEAFGLAGLRTADW
jgi:hypothetical protein